MSLEPQRAGPRTDSPEAAKPATGRTSTRAKSIDWRQNALTVLEALANTGVPFHVDDFLMLAGDPPCSKMIGGAFAAAKQQHIIEAVGAAVASDGRLVRVWVRCHR
jgi:hypothetical protein